MSEEARKAAIQFHETYERLAPQFGYETRPDTKAFDPDSPNGRLMIAVCGEVLNAHAEHTAAIREKASELVAALDKMNAYAMSEWGGPFLELESLTNLKAVLEEKQNIKTCKYCKSPVGGAVKCRCL